MTDQDRPAHGWGGMEQSAELLLRVYQRALAHLQSIDAGIEDHLKRLFTPGAGRIAPTMRDLAFLEGLRSERDEAHAGCREAEHRLVNHLLRQLGLSSDAAK